MAVIVPAASYRIGEFHLFTNHFSVLKFVIHMSMSLLRSGIVKQLTTRTLLLALASFSFPSVFMLPATYGALESAEGPALWKLQSF